MGIYGAQLTQVSHCTLAPTTWPRFTLETAADHDVITQVNWQTVLDLRFSGGKTSVVEDAVSLWNSERSVKETGA